MTSTARCGALQELKIQTQRVSRKSEIIFPTDESIPSDPDPPTQLNNALADSTMNRSLLCDALVSHLRLLVRLSSSLGLISVLHRLHLLSTKLMSKLASQSSQTMSNTSRSLSSAFSSNGSPTRDTAISSRLLILSHTCPPHLPLSLFLPLSLSLSVCPRLIARTRQTLAS
jgi:hypothetical protein